jgi:hypothetical protein
MDRNSTFPLLTALLVALGAASVADAHNKPLRGFVCVVDLPPFDPSGRDATSKTTTDSQLTCGRGDDGPRNDHDQAGVHLKCRAPLSTEEFAELGGETQTFRDTPCQIDLRMCGALPSGAQRFVLASKSELRINRKEAKIECQL